MGEHLLINGWWLLLSDATGFRPVVRTACAVPFRACTGRTINGATVATQSFGPGTWEAKHGEQVMGMMN